MHHFKGLIGKLPSCASKDSRLKEEQYMKNGSSVLEEFIALCDGKCRIPLRYLSAIEIERATQDKNTVVSTSSGHMVKGLLDKRRVLVRFTNNTPNRNSREICRDIAVTSQMSHLNNVLKLTGCCLEYAKPVMVYEYVEEAVTLADLLFSNVPADRNSSLPWASRLRIANDIASAIVFLHSEFTTPIIFRDLHSQKVLIDESSGVAKLFDFSFCVSLPPGELEVEPQGGVPSTYGFADTEYLCSGTVTQKTDVYGFGNVLFQLLTGKRTYVQYGVMIYPGQNYLESDIKECNVMDIADPVMILAEERGIHEIRQQLEDCFDLAKRCTVSNGDDRPYMICVAKELRRIEKVFSCPLCT